MKKLTFILSFFLFLMSFISHKNALAEEKVFYYAKISSNSTYLCSTPSENSAMIEIPYSYFVKVEYVIDDYFKVSYDNVEGYVKKDKVSLMKGTPEVPFASATFKLFVPYGLYSSANSASTKICDIDTSQTVKYYGRISGQQLSSSSNNWYYCSLINGDQTVFGYVFSGVTDYLTTISINNETFESVTEDVFSSTPQASEFSTLSSGTKILLIVSISIPSLLILYFLIKPSRILKLNKSKKIQQKNPKKTRRHSDYFEFDESEI